jgi:hypothetical protein
VAVSGVPSGELLYVAPDMVVHYIEEIGYRPPAEFLEAVLHSPLPDTEEYQLITEPFWHKHRVEVERMMQSTVEQGAAADRPRGSAREVVWGAMLSSTAVS